MKTTHFLEDAIKESLVKMADEIKRQSAGAPMVRTVKPEMTARELLHAFICEARHNKCHYSVVLDSDEIPEGKESECIDRVIAKAAEYAEKYPDEAMLEPLGNGIYFDPKHRTVADEMTDVITVQLTSINSNDPTELSDGQIKLAMRRLEERLKEVLTDDDVRVTLWQQFITKSHEEEV